MRECLRRCGVVLTCLASAALVACAGQPPEPAGGIEAVPHSDSIVFPTKADLVPILGSCLTPERWFDFIAGRLRAGIARGEDPSAILKREWMSCYHVSLDGAYLRVVWLGDDKTPHSQRTVIKKLW